MEYKFRTKVYASDIETVGQIVKSTNFFNDEEVTIAKELVEETVLKGEDSGYEFIFAETNDQVVAYICYGRIPCTKHSYDLYWIVTHKDFQSEGIGKRLIDEFEKEIKDKGARGIYVETSSKQQYLPTRKFYEKMNYEQKAIFEDFYDINDSKVIFVKYLY